MGETFDQWYQSLRLKTKHRIVKEFTYFLKT